MKNCTSMAEIRTGIDRIDLKIVDLLAERQAYVENAGRIKLSRDLVRDQDRVDDVIGKVRSQAVATAADPEMVETTYRAMVDWFIAYEFKVFDTRNELTR